MEKLQENINLGVSNMFQHELLGKPMGKRIILNIFMAGQPTPPLTYPPRNKGFNKALFLGGVR